MASIIKLRSAENSRGVMARSSVAVLSALIRSIIISGEGTGLSTVKPAGALVSGSGPPILDWRAFKNSSLVIISFSASSFIIRKREMIFCSCGVNRTSTALTSASETALLLAAFFCSRINKASSRAERPCLAAASSLMLKTLTPLSSSIISLLWLMFIRRRRFWATSVILRGCMSSLPRTVVWSPAERIISS